MVPEPAQRARAGTYLFFFVSFALVVCLTHAGYFDLPYYWDELGQFVPAALDIYQRGAWVAERTIPNVHPPGLMAYLAGVWTVFGYSTEATRAAMLLLASLTVFVVFLLAIELTKGARGAPAFAAVLFLLVSPLFYTQAMLAELDMPAMLLSSWALLLFLQERPRAAALVCVAAVLVKETTVVVPAVFALWLLKDRRWRDAAWFVLPPVALAGWILFLWRATGNPLGNSEFAQYNITFALHPVRIAIALARRAFYLGIENFHWLGWIFVFFAWRKGVFRTRAWKIAGAVALAHVLVVTVLGGAVLERYLLPALAIMYVAFAVAMPRVAQVALAAGLVFALFWNPPYPFPYENNLAMVDFVRLQKTAAQYVEKRLPGRTVTTAWPLTEALWLPELGYVGHRVHIQRVQDFTPGPVGALDPKSVDVFVLFSRDWVRAGDPRSSRLLRGLVRRAYHWQPPVDEAYIESRFALQRVAYWESRGQWAAVFVRR